MDKPFLIIIPTYNEADNIAAIINKINELSDLKNVGFDIVVVDDNSPDGTAQIVQSISKHSSNVILINRQCKCGLAQAYIFAFEWGLSKGYQFFCQMDADFSHNPEYLSGMFNLAKSNDYIVGSRYVKNGGVTNWGVIRRLISFGGCLYSRIILNSPIKDQTGGFNLWTRKVLENIGLDEIISNGYSFQIELKYRAHRKGYKYYEYPIIFDERRAGRSKMSKHIFVEAIFNVWRLRFSGLKGFREN